MHREHQIRRRAVWADPALLFRQQSHSLAVGAEPRGEYVEKDLTRVCYERDAAIVPPFDHILFEQKFYHGILPPLRYLRLVPYRLEHPMKRSEHGRVMVHPGLRSSIGSSSSPTAFAFTVVFKAAVTSFYVGSTPRVCEAERWRRSTIIPSLVLSNFALRRVPKNRAHLPRMSPGSHKSFPLRQGCTAN